MTAYNKALEDAIAVLDKIAMAVDVNDRKFLAYSNFTLSAAHVILHFTSLTFMEIVIN